MYDLDNTRGGIRDCPKCKHTMTYLHRYNAIERNEGYMIDDERDGNFLLFLVGGWIGLVLKALYRHTLKPLVSKSAGEQRQRRYAKIIQEYPHSLICPHCNHILRQK